MSSGQYLKNIFCRCLRNSGSSLIWDKRQDNVKMTYFLFLVTSSGRSASDGFSGKVLQQLQAHHLGRKHYLSRSIAHWLVTDGYCCTIKDVWVFSLRLCGIWKNHVFLWKTRTGAEWELLQPLAALVSMGSGAGSVSCCAARLQGFWPWQDSRTALLLIPYWLYGLWKIFMWDTFLATCTPQSY